MKSRKTLARDVFDTVVTNAGLEFMTSPSQTIGNKTAALTIMFLRISNVNFLTNRIRNRVKNCYVSYIFFFYSIHIWCLSHPTHIYIYIYIYHNLSIGPMMLLRFGSPLNNDSVDPIPLIPFAECSSKTSVRFPPIALITTARGIS